MCIVERSARLSVATWALSVLLFNFSGGKAVSLSLALVAGSVVTESQATLGGLPPIALINQPVTLSGSAPPSTGSDVEQGVVYSVGDGQEFAQVLPPQARPSVSSTASPVSSRMPVGSPLVDPTYTLGPGDQVLITFFNVPEYSGEQVVVVDGTLNFPMLGRVLVAGMTLAEAEVAIAETFRSELRYPNVTVTLFRPRPLQVGIVGEVNRPGLYTLNSTQGDQTQTPSLAQIIQIAGGTTQAANLRQIEIRRARRTGQPQVIAANLWDFLRNGDINQNLTLRDGDTVFIPATTEVNLAEAAQLAASNLATNSEQALDVALIGEVRRPGAYKLGGEGGLSAQRQTLTQAIRTAGGVTPSADLRRIEVRRPTRFGEDQVIQINLWELVRSGNLEQDLILQQGDTITIPTATALTPEESVQLATANVSPELIRISVAGQVESPATLQLAPDSTLNQAILSAGGFNRRANRSVILVRLNPDGTVSRTAIDVDLSENVSTEDNPILRDGDVILARRSGLAFLTDGLEQFGGFLSPLFNLISIFD